MNKSQCRHYLKATQPKTAGLIRPNHHKFWRLVGYFIPIFYVEIL